MWRAARWLARTSRPRSVAELLTLLLALLATGAAALGAVTAAATRTVPGSALVWCLLLAGAALAARTVQWWGPEVRAMTPDRARKCAAIALLLFVAISVAWHSLSATLGFGGAYGMLGPVSAPPGSVAILILVTGAGLALLLNLPAGRWVGAFAGLIAGSLSSARRRRVLHSISVADDSVFFEAETLAGTEERGRPLVTASAPKQTAPAPEVPHIVPQIEPPPGPPLPPISTFAAPARAQAAPVDLDGKAKRIQETLASFNVSARVVGYHCGPAVTQFDVQPERGVKVKSITALQNDLALALAAPTIRIQAPVPGKSVVGIEIPNSATTTVALRELLESDAYRALSSPLAVVLGKDVAGNPSVIDLAKMPHLLIAGATGSGKSVCVNALISCLLYRNTPDDVRLMMVDPKMVELTVYNGVPHLLSPVITNMEKVVGVLQWALREMERRYQMFADATVRNIQRYNEKMNDGGGKRLPYVVLVVDELADLMMVAPEEVEDSVCRLAQLARAAGIHLVIATQRPSVDVVTGLIKANFPARIAFAMTSQVDSRTILDTSGAEKLLGRGDMLYLPPDAPKPVRLQGAYLKEQEIERLVEFWKRSPLQTLVSRVPAEEFVAAERAAGNADDDLIHEAIRVVREYQHASVSLLQRRLRIGYARAARVMDQLEARGVVGPADGSKQRPVLDQEAVGPA